MPLLLRNAAITALLGFAAYSLAGFVVVPHLAVRWIEETALDGHGLRARIGDAAFNPFTLAVSFSDITVSGHESPPLVSMERVAGVLEPGSLFGSRRAFAGVVTLSGLLVEGTAGEATLQVPTGFARGVSEAPGHPGLQIETLQLPNATLRLRRDQKGAWAPPGWLAVLARPGPPVRGIELTAGRLLLVDSASGAPPAHAELAFIANVAVDKPGAVRADIELSGGQAHAQLAARWDAADSEFPASVHLDIDGMRAKALAPYAAAAVALQPSTGTVNLSVSANRLARGVGVFSRLGFTNVQWERAPGEARKSHQGAQLATRDAAMAMALLEDKHGQAVLEGSYLVPGREPGEALSSLVPRLIAGSLGNAAGQPFAELAKVAHWRGADLSLVAFAPGSVQMEAASVDSVRALGSAMLQRPLVGVVVWAGYDSEFDRLALARQQVAQHIALATSTTTAGRSGTAIDTDNPRVRVVIDEFAENRLTTVQQAMIVGQFHATRQGYYRAVLNALAENETVKPSATRRLARYRGRAIVRELRALGIDEARLKIGPGSEQLNAEDGAVALRLEVWPVKFSEPAASGLASTDLDNAAR